MTTLHITIGDRNALREETIHQLDIADSEEADESVEPWGDRRGVKKRQRRA